MKSFILRNVDDSLFKEIKRQSEKKSMSINKYIISLIKSGIGFPGESKKQKSFSDLDKLAGNWSNEEYELITERIKEQRRIESELWK